MRRSEALVVRKVAVLARANSSTRRLPSMDPRLRRTWFSQKSCKCRCTVPEKSCLGWRRSLRTFSSSYRRRRRRRRPVTVVDEMHHPSCTFSHFHIKDLVGALAKKEEEHEELLVQHRGARSCKAISWFAAIHRLGKPTSTPSLRIVSDWSMRPTRARACPL